MKIPAQKIIFYCMLTLATAAWAQNQSVTIGGTQTDTDAVLWLVGNGQQGLLLPITSDPGSMPLKAGLVVYSTTDKNIYYCDGNKWTALGGAAGAPQTLTLNGNTLNISNGNNISIASAAPTQIGQILMWDGTKWTSNTGASAPLDQQVLRWNNAQARWEPATLSSGGTVTNVTVSAPLSVTNGTTIPAISLQNSGVTAGTYGSTSAIPELTIDAFGRVTAATARTIPTADGNTAGVLSTTDYARFGNKMNGNILTTAGDILVHDGTNISRLPRGTDKQVLTSTASGIQWAAPTGTDAQDLSLSGTTLSLTNDATPVNLGGLAILSAVSGGLGGTITDNSITGEDLATASVDLTSNDVTGTLPIAKGGIGITSTPASNQVLIGNGTGFALSTLTQGSGINISNTGGILTIASTATDAQDLSLSGTTLSLTNDATPVNLGGLAILSNISTNEIPNGTIVASDLNSMGAVDGQVLKFNTGTGLWAPGTDNAGAGGAPTLNDGQIIIGNGTTNSAATLDGDATLSAGNLTLKNSNAVRTNLGLAIGTNVQAYDADLDDLADGSLTGSKVGTGISATNITTGTLGVANGGTGATTLSGVVIGNGASPLAGIGTNTALQYFRRNAANNGYEFATLSIGTNEISDGSITGTDLNTGISISTTGNIATTGAGTFSGIGSGLTALNASNISSGSLALNRLTTGTDTHVLTMVAGVPAWQAPSGGGATTLDGLTDVTLTSPVSANILVHNGSGQFINAAMGGDAQISTTGFVTLANTTAARSNLGLAIGSNVQAYDVDLDDLADGSLSGSKVGTGISATNITTGTLGVANGGTGATTLSGVVLGNGTGALSGVSTSTALQYFRRNAANNGYEFATLSIGTNEISDGSITGTDLNTGLSISTTGNIATTGAGTFSGIGSGLTSLNASNISSGTLALNRLTTGTDTHVLTMVAGVPAWQAPASSGWSLAGNAPASGDFIGTTNSEDLVFKTSGFERMRLSGSLGGLGIGTSPAAGVGLHVHGSGTGLLRITTAGIGSGPSDGFGIFVQNDGTTQMMNNENSILQIGTDNSWAIQVGSNSSLAFGNPLSYGTDGMVLTSQGPGFPAQWENAPGGFTLNTEIPRGNGSGMVSSNIFSDGINIGIGTTPNPGTYLTVKTNEGNTTNYGSYMDVSGATATNAGIFSTANGTGSTSNFGADLYANGGTSTVGVRATANGASNSNFGVAGYANGTTANYAIYGFANNGSSNWAGYFDGDTHISGAISLGPSAGGGSEGADGQVLTSQGPGLPAQWESPGSSTGWALLGNAGTTDVSNFIGTTDGIPLNFKVNNQKSGRIDHLSFNTSFGYQSGRDNSTGTNNTSFGYYALRLNTTATHNTAVGSSALESNSIGISNTALGYNALNNNTASSQNTAVGRGALFTMSFSPGAAYNGNNTAIGFESLYNDQPVNSSTGVRNTAIGYRAGYNNTTGSDNVSIGYAAGPSTGALNNTIAIGYNASVSASNTMILGGTGADQVSVGIGVTDPNRELQVHNGVGGDAYMQVTTTTTGATTTDGLFIGSNAGIAEILNKENTALDFYTNNSFRMRISETGNVGLGTNTPSVNKLYVNIPSTDATNPVGIRVDNNYTGSSTKYGIDVNVDGAGSGSKYGISSSIVGLAGDASPIYGYQVSMTPSGTGSAFGLYSNLSSAGTGIRYGLYNTVFGGATNTSVVYGQYNQVTNSGSGDSYILYGINSSAGAGVEYGIYTTGEDYNYFNGNVRIGTNSGTRTLNVAGDIDATGGIYFGSAESLTDGGTNEIAANADFRPTANGLYSIGTSTFRWSTVYATNGTISTSDARLKENINNLRYGLKEVMKLRPVSYTWKDGNADTKLGFIAQETELIIPEVVKKPSDASGYYGLMYSDLVPVTVKAIQEQQAMIDQQKTEIEALKLKLAEFEAFRAEFQKMKELLSVEAKKASKQ